MAQRFWLLFCLFCGFEGVVFAKSAPELNLPLKYHCKSSGMGTGIELKAFAMPAGVNHPFLIALTVETRSVSSGWKRYTNVLTGHYCQSSGKSKKYGANDLCLWDLPSNGWVGSLKVVRDQSEAAKMSFNHDGFSFTDEEVLCPASRQK